MPNGGIFCDLKTNVKPKLLKINKHTLDFEFLIFEIHWLTANSND